MAKDLYAQEYREYSYFYENVECVSRMRFVKHLYVVIGSHGCHRHDSSIDKELRVNSLNH